MTQFCWFCLSELEDSGPLCPRCQSQADWLAWREQTRAEVESLAEKLGWAEDGAYTASTGSVYLEFSRAGTDPILRIRISNHWPNEARYSAPAAFRQPEPDLDLIYGGGGNTLDQLEHLFKKKTGEENHL